MNPTVVESWPKIRSNISYHAGKLGKSAEEIEATLKQLHALALACSSYSQQRKMAQCIGQLLLESDGAPLIYAPCCADYRNTTDGKTDFSAAGLGMGIPPLALQQIRFLQRIQEIVPQARPILLMPDQEGSKHEKARARGLTEEEIRDRICASAQALQKHVEGTGIAVSLFSVLMPNVVERELCVAEELLADPKALYVINDMAHSRASYYHQMDSRMIYADRSRLQARSAAQYVVLGQFAAQKRALLCSYNQESIPWYNRTEAVILSAP